MNRVKWLEARWPISMRAIGIKMKELSFQEGGIDGFIIERIRDDFIEGRFIEKYSYQEIVIEPFGEDKTVERIGYRSTGFSLFSNYPQIELRNSQRSTKEFVTRLLEICNFSLSVLPVTVNVLDWAGDFQCLIESEIVIDSMQVSDLEVEEGVKGKLLLRGSKDVRQAADGIVGNRRFNIEKVQAKVHLQSKSFSVQLSNSGAAKLPIDYTADLLPLLRKTLPTFERISIL